MDKNIKQSLQDLAGYFNTDKLSHGYIPAYEQHLPAKPKKILEIGAGKGGSIKMWQSYFPEAEIHCLDLFEDPNHISEQELKDLGIITHKGDQTDLDLLRSLPENFDVIIDDGSHNAADMIITYRELFKPKMAKNGLYVIEDLHCCTDPFYWNGWIKSFEETILGAAKANQIGHKHFLYLDKIIFIYAH